MNRGLYCFTHDLRLQDNPSLTQLCLRCDQIDLVYIVDPKWQSNPTSPPNPLSEQQTSTPTTPDHRLATYGSKRWQFVLQSLQDIQQSLTVKGQRITILYGDTASLLTDYIQHHQINEFGFAQQVGWYERKAFERVTRQCRQVTVTSDWQHTLFQPEQLVELGLFEREICDTHTRASDHSVHQSVSQKRWDSFSRFRGKVEKANLKPRECVQLLIEQIPPPVVKNHSFKSTHSLPSSMAFQAVLADVPFDGGETAAVRHLTDYFSGSLAATYKQTRNAIDDWDSSTKLSPFLALGNLSPTQIWQRLKNYEQHVVANDSTYWIYFELLWREYFQWLALKQGANLFKFQGIAKQAPLTTFSASRFAMWTQGSTPYASVNAAMKQLKATGYLSNRARQIVASALVNELAVDWRFGAAYFQHHLIDHDVASNWGNWQYIAGVGVDPRGGRHFNLAKQSELFDPNGDYVRRWQGDRQLGQLDSVDAADWPLT